MSDDIVKLNIGAGNTKLEGFISIDLYNKNADINRDAADTGFKENSVNFILSSHMVEHLEPDHFIKALEHWYKILIPGGQLQILCPNASVYVREWLDAFERSDYNYLIEWGNRNLLGWSGGGVGVWNRNLFTPEILRYHLEQANFKIIKCCEAETRVKNIYHIEFRENGDIVCIGQK